MMTCKFNNVSGSYIVIIGIKTVAEGFFWEDGAVHMRPSSIIGTERGLIPTDSKNWIHQKEDEDLNSLAQRAIDTFKLN